MQQPTPQARLRLPGAQRMQRSTAAATGAGATGVHVMAVVLRHESTATDWPARPACRPPILRVVRRRAGQCEASTHPPCTRVPPCRSDDIVRWVKKKTGPATTEVADVAALETAEKENKVGA